MKKKSFKLALNKETLIKLQEQQMRALAGGSEDDTISMGASSQPGSCTSTTKCTIASPGTGCTGEEVSALAVEPSSCCKKSCNNPDPQT